MPSATLAKTVPKAAMASAPQRSARELAPAEPDREPGLPLFLQLKCAACSASGPCPQCEEEEKRVQMASESGGASVKGSGFHSIAGDGIRGASQPLPHFDTIQAAFGG